MLLVENMNEQMKNMSRQMENRKKESKGNIKNWNNTVTDEYL